MSTLSLTLVKAKVLKDGAHKIRIAVHHHHETRYIITRFSVADNQFKDERVVKRPDASIINAKLRGLLDIHLVYFHDAKLIFSLIPTKF